MSRKYLNDRWCVRCSRRDIPTPYLRDNIKLFTEDGRPKYKTHVIDIGCGNCRNTRFMRNQGFHEVKPVDMAPPNKCITCVLGKDPLPFRKGYADVILCNYVLMFLDGQECKQIFNEILRVAAPGCYLMVELYPAKDSYMNTEAACLRYQKALYEAFRRKGWEKKRYSKMRFIVRKTG